MSIIAAPPSLGGVAAAVEARLASVLGAEAARWGTIDPDACEPLDALCDLVTAGGKRLRPAFCYWAFVGAGGDPADPAIIDAGAALELLHTFALIHDDVMDGSTRRHGAETLHVAFERHHREAQWHGSSSHFGLGVAVLVGDLAHVYAQALMTGAPGPAIDVFNELRLEIHFGQYLDLRGSATRVADAQLARRICRYKTGKYTVERPLHLGAALAAPWQLPELIDPLSAFGCPLGEAFQLRDDLLGVFGDPLLTGKPVGDDLREAKPTLLVSLARQAASGADSALLERYLGDPQLDEATIAEMAEVIERCGARAQVVAAIDALVVESLDALPLLPLSSESRQVLGEMASFVAGRDH